MLQFKIQGTEPGRVILPAIGSFCFARRGLLLRRLCLASEIKQCPKQPSLAFWSMVPKLRRNSHIGIRGTFENLYPSKASRVQLNIGISGTLYRRMGHILQRLFRPALAFQIFRGNEFFRFLVIDYFISGFYRHLGHKLSAIQAFSLHFINFIRDFARINLSAFEAHAISANQAHFIGI